MEIISFPPSHTLTMCWSFGVAMTVNFRHFSQHLSGVITASKRRERNRNKWAIGITQKLNLIAINYFYVWTSRGFTGDIFSFSCTINTQIMINSWYNCMKNVSHIYIAIMRFFFRWTFELGYFLCVWIDIKSWTKTWPGPTVE